MQTLTPSNALRPQLIMTAAGAGGVKPVATVNPLQPSAALLESGALKRPATGDLPHQPIGKTKKMAWVESQVKKDQHEALNPNLRMPFHSREDACKRLLRYHVFDELDTDPKELLKTDENFENKSNFLITKYRSMLDKYHYLLITESMVS